MAIGREKLAPVTSLFTAFSDDEAVTLSLRLLANEGAGHTAIIHTRSEGRIARFSREMPVSLVLVTCPAPRSLGLVTELALLRTLGTGTFGHTSTTDSVRTYRHLLNINGVPAYGLAA